MGIGEKAWQRTGTLSGGQQQRAAIARALVQRARVLLADEPIASLDPESARNVMQTLRDLNQKDGLTVVVTLHQVDYAMRFCPRTVALKKGEIVYDGPTERLTPQFLAELYGAESDELFAAKTNTAQEAVTLPGQPCPRDVPRCLGPILIPLPHHFIQGENTCFPVFFPACWSLPCCWAAR